MVWGLIVPLRFSDGFFDMKIRVLGPKFLEFFLILGDLQKAWAQSIPNSSYTQKPLTIRVKK